MRGQNLEPQMNYPAKTVVYKLLRFHIHDWLIIFALAILDGSLNIIKPFYHFVGESFIGDYMFPLKKNTIPFQSVPVIALIIPITIFFLYFLYKRDIADFHHAILGLLFSVLITAVITDAVKDALGLPRPDFFWRCFPDGKAVKHRKLTWCFAGLGFLSLYIGGKLQIFDRRGHVGKTALMLLPLLGALLVGLSRVNDYWHHWQDVFAGAFLGLTIAILCYHQFFPGIYLATSMEVYCHAHMNEKAPAIFGSWSLSLRRRSPPGDWPPGNSTDDMENGGRTNIPLV